MNRRPNSTQTCIHFREPNRVVILAFLRLEAPSYNKATVCFRPPKVDHVGTSGGRSQSHVSLTPVYFSPQSSSYANCSPGEGDGVESALSAGAFEKKDLG